MSRRKKLGPADVPDNAAPPPVGNPVLASASDTDQSQVSRSPQPVNRERC